MRRGKKKRFLRIVTSKSRDSRQKTFDSPLTRAPCIFSTCTGIHYYHIHTAAFCVSTFVFGTKHKSPPGEWACPYLTRSFMHICVGRIIAPKRQNPRTLRTQQNRVRWTCHVCQGQNRGGAGEDESSAGPTSILMSISLSLLMNIYL